MAERMAASQRPVMSAETAYQWIGAAVALSIILSFIGGIMVATADVGGWDDESGQRALGFLLMAVSSVLGIIGFTGIGATLAIRATAPDVPATAP